MKLRKVWSFLLVFIMLAGMLAVQAQAEDEVPVGGTCGRNLKWTLEEGVLTISGTGGMTNYYESSTAPWYSNRTKITSVVVENGVTSIGSYAFWSCSKLASIQLPASVTSIGDYAFCNCTKLTGIDLPAVKSIGYRAFYNCTKLTDIDLPAVKSIGSDAFYGCSSLTAIEIPYGVKTIPFSAFRGCTNLKRVDLPDSVTSIYDFAFWDCSSLADIDLPDSVVSLGFSVFHSCSSLTGIVIPDGVTTLREDAFSGCSSLVSIEIPDSVTSIEYSAFRNCSSLTGIVIPEGVTSIGNDAFYGCSSLISIEIPDGVTSIEGRSYDGTFYGCSSLVSIEIPDSVTTIGENAFYGCSSLTSIELPGVASVGSSAFKGCSKLTSIEIPVVTSIGTSAFYGCYKISDVYYGGTVDAWKSLSNKPSATFVHYGCTAANHWVADHLDATCGVPGYDREICACGYECNRVAIPATGDHVFDLEIVDEKYLVSAATCTEKAVYWKSCGVCGLASDKDTFEYGEPNGHAHESVVTAPTCTENGYTTYTCHCGDTYVADEVEKLGHDMSQWEILKEMTPYADGSKRRDCANCDHFETEVIPAQGEKLAITTQPVSATAKLNSTVTFKVVAAGTNLTYQWEYMNPSVGKWYASEMTGNKTAAMKVEAIAFRNGFQYRCEITDVYGTVVYSDAVKLSVSELTVINTQPKSATAKLGETVNFTVGATGKGIKYQWQYKNPSVGTWYNSEMTGNKTSTLQVGAIAFRNGFQYRCKITDENGNVIYSNAATLTVKTGPTITSQPASVSAVSGDKVTFKVTATGTKLTYQWEYMNPAVGVWYSSGMTGNKTATMKFDAIMFRNGFQYRCKITDADGITVYSNAATLTVKSVSLTVTTQPADVTAKVGDTVNFKVVATGSGLTYQWEYLNPSVGTWENSGMTGNRTSNLQVGAIVFRNGFKYRCRITDENGNVIYSNAAKLTVKSGPSITTQPASVTANLGETVTFKIVATGNGLTYQWQYMNPTVGIWYSSEMTGNKTAAMQVGAIAFRNNFQYRCKITDADGNVVYSNTATLIVKSGPSITTQPTSTYLKSGSTANFKVIATGTGLTYQWQWRKDSSSTWAATTVSGNKTATITVPVTTARNGYQYRCKITDGSGNVVYSNAATLTVFGIKTQPANATAKLNEKVNFKVVATGTGLTYQWQYNGTSSNGEWKNTTLASADTNALNLVATVARNGYKYRCKITDSKGNVIYTNAAKLTVE